MSRFLAVGGAVLRKDCQELWPQAAATAAVVAISSASANAPWGDTWLNLMRVAALALASILIVRLIQSDSPASVRHDWLTRPVPWLTLLSAKSAFLLLWLALPQALGGTLKGVFSGYSLGEALLEGVQQSVPPALLLGVVAVSVITGTIWQAVLLLVGTVVLHETVLAVVTAEAQKAGWLDPGYFRSMGTAWVRDWAQDFLAIIVSALILWWQYVRRKTAQARTVYAGGVALALTASILMLPAARTFAVQKRLGSDPAAAAQVAVELMPGCFLSPLTSRALGSAWADGPLGVVGVPDNLWRSEGLDAVVFGTVLTVREPVQDDHLILGHPTAKYVDADGRTLFAVRGFYSRLPSSTMVGGRAALTHYWVLPRERYEQLAARADVRLQLDYSLSLLVPKTRAVVSMDGRREFFSGLGYCGARQQHSDVTADCFKAGPQPALLLATRVGGVPSADKAGRDPDFTPAMLSWLAGRRYQISVAPSEVPSSQVQITAYVARAHFQRRLTAPGILGGTIQACPAPGTGNQQITR
jgi:hypothetical protein